MACPSARCIAGLHPFQIEGTIAFRGSDLARDSREEIIAHTVPAKTIDANLLAFRAGRRVTRD